MTGIEGRTTANPPVDGFQALVVNPDGSLNATVGAVVPGATPIDVSGFVASTVVIAAPARLVSFSGRNRNAATVFIMFFDALVVPAPGAIPDRLPIAAITGGHFSLAQPSDFAVGIVWAASTTDATLTVLGTADVWIDTSFVLP